MICQRCEEKEASVHLTKIINGEKTELYLCEDCARESGQLPFNSSNPFSFQNLLSGLLNPELNSLNSPTEQVCENCGMGYQEFTKQGLFGCANCYDAFDNRLDPLFKRIHGSNRHNGKVPERRGGTLKIKKEIADLRQALQEVIANENFERAAEIRDKIYELEENMRGE